MLNQQEFENAPREKQIALMIEELKKKKRKVKIVLTIEAFVIVRQLLKLPAAIQSISIENLVSTLGCMVVGSAIIFLIVLRQAKNFEKDLDEQTTDLEKQLYK